MNNNTFPSSIVVSSFIDVEASLKEFLDVVPYCPEHESVWSPHLVTIILEACSQLDSLWRSTAEWQGQKTAKELSVKDYFTLFGRIVSARWVVFWSSPAPRLCPFDNWYRKGKYQSLDWWQSYNSVKHNRLANVKEATLRNTVHAVAGLFLSIVKNELCTGSIKQMNWLCGGHNNNPAAYLAESGKSDTVRLAYATAESKLFTYPVWLGAQREPEKYFWGGQCSNRFRAWIDSK